MTQVSTPKIDPDGFLRLLSRDASLESRCAGYNASNGSVDDIFLAIANALNRITCQTFRGDIAANDGGTAILVESIFV